MVWCNIMFQDVALHKCPSLNWIYIENKNLRESKRDHKKDQVHAHFL